MATKYNFEAQRPQDVTVRTTSKQPDKSWDTVKEREPHPWVHSEPIETRAPKIKPRVIKVTLDVSERIGMDASSVTWMLNIPSIGALAEGTVLYWRELVTNQTETCDWALSGLGAHSYALSGPSYTLRARFIQSGSTTSWYSNNLAPLAVTLKDTDVFFNKRLTVTRIGATGATLDSINGLQLKVCLVFVEPGARYF